MKASPLGIESGFNTICVLTYPLKRITLRLWLEWHVREKNRNKIKGKHYTSSRKMLLPNRLHIKSHISMRLTLTLASGMDPGFLVLRVEWAAIWGLREWDKFCANSSFWKQCPKSSHSHGGLFFQVDEHCFPGFSSCYIRGFENTHRLTQPLPTMTKVFCALIYHVYSLVYL